MSYQEESAKFAVYWDPLYPFMGLCEEAGELIGVINKRRRKGDVKAVHNRCPVLMDELGDVMWMVAACCRELNVSMEEVMEMNLKKLEARAGDGELDRTPKDAPCIHEWVMGRILAKPEDQKERCVKCGVLKDEL